MTGVTVYLVLAGVLVIVILMGLPVAWAMGLVSLVGVMYYFGGVWDIRASATVAQQSFYGVNNFVLVAVPLFLLMGNLMNIGGVTTRLFAFASCMTRPLKGGLGHANVLASMFFAGMSGSATADAAGLGTIEMKAMLSEGYDREFSAGITGASSLIGPIIPPSIAFVVYGVVAEVSVAALFLGGVVPGILLGLSQMAYVSFLAYRRNYPSARMAPFSEIVRAFKDAFLPLMAPVMLLVGIYSGVFTPTEAASVVVIYAIILGLLVYRGYNLKGLMREIRSTMVLSASIMIIVAFVEVFGKLMIRGQVPMVAAEFIAQLTTNPTILMLLFTLFWLLVGLFMSQSPAILILTPILLPIAKIYGIDPVHFGVVMTLGLTLGQLTPPVGLVLYVLVKVTGLPFERLVIIMVPYIAITYGVVLMLIFVPELVLFLPNLLHY